MSKIIIAVISHKPTEIPNNSIYKLIEVNAIKHEEHFSNYLDSDNINISNKNDSYCELTGIYEVYKNYEYDILGLVHYRRYFAKSNFCLIKNIKNVITSNQINKLLNKYDIILPKKRHYYIETNYSHYIHAHKREALDIMSKIIEKDYPDYYSIYKKFVFKKRTGHYFNMFIAKKEIINPYLDWMFEVLSKVESKIDINTYTDQERRVFGYLSELLINVYAIKNNLKIKSQKYFFMEKQNWFKKILNFLKRSLGHGS